MNDERYDYETNQSRNQRLLETTYLETMVRGMVTLWGGELKPNTRGGFLIVLVTAVITLLAYAWLLGVF